MISPFLFLIPFILLNPNSVSADQAAILAPNGALSSALSSLSSFFTAKPTSTRAASPSFCCGDDCPPGACNLNHIVPTNLAYAFPPPSSNPSPTTSLTLPCCHGSCPDGACRTKPLILSQRPTLTQPPRFGPTSQDIIIGCCKKCRNCDQAVTTTDAESLMRAATPEAEITASPSLDDAVDQDPDTGNGGESADICIGCGRCRPCDQAKIATWVEFMPAPTQKKWAAESFAESASAATTAAAAKSANGKSDDEKEEPEPTIYLADDLNLAINGLNQDYLPIIIQNGGSDTGIAGAAASFLGTATGKELRTILATIDLKLSDNYISRRLLKQLSRLGDVVSYPKGVDPSIAILSQDLDQVSIDATIVLDLVAGAADDNTRKLFQNVRFNVYGDEDDDIVKQGVGEVILGMKLLAETQALVIAQRIREEVQVGVRVVEKAHFGKILGRDEEEGGDKEKEHDEL